VRKIKTIIVDDSIQFSEAIAAYFADIKEISIIKLITNGAECLEFCINNKPDLALIDVRMSGFEGPEIARQLRAMYPDIKIIMITVWPENEARVYAFQARADDYFVKGEHLPCLLEKIHNLFPNKQ
jgi:DNA-binding NarL/FixJ family response regulator